MRWLLCINCIYCIDIQIIIKTTFCNLKHLCNILCKCQIVWSCLISWSEKSKKVITASHLASNEKTLDLFNVICDKFTLNLTLWLNSTDNIDSFLIICHKLISSKCAILIKINSSVEVEEENIRLSIIAIKLNNL